jgi:hypothetical protein
MTDPIAIKAKRVVYNDYGDLLRGIADKQLKEPTLNDALVNIPVCADEHKIPEMSDRTIYVRYQKKAHSETGLASDVSWHFVECYYQRPLGEQAPAPRVPAGQEVNGPGPSDVTEGAIQLIEAYNAENPDNPIDPTVIVPKGAKLMKNDVKHFIAERDAASSEEVN